MFIHLHEIFYDAICGEDFETDINILLDKYKIYHDGYILVNKNKSIHIEDDNGNIILESMLSNSKRLYYSVDTVNILSQFYMYSKKDNDNYFNFIKDCCNVILKRINLVLFKYIDLISKNDEISVIFELYNIQCKMTIFNKIKGDGINRISLNVNIKEPDSSQDKYFTLIKSKPLKAHNTQVIDLLYQMIMCSHYFISYIRELPTWDEM